LTFPSPLSPLPAGSLVPKWNGKWGPASGMKLPFPVYFMTELSDIPEPRWLVKNLLVEGSHHVIWGEPQSGKSLWALDMALCLATGIPWQQHASFDPVTSTIGPTYPVKRSNVLYLAGEGTQGLRARSDAWRQRYGLSPSEFADLNQPLVGSATVIPEAFQVNPLSPDYAAGLTAVVEQAEISVVVIDTLARYYVGDENQQEAMGRYINFVDGFMKAGITVITIHHANKSGSERGSSALRGAATSSRTAARSTRCIWIWWSIGSRPTCSPLWLSS
jgi:RecA-family ATPase